MSFSFFYCLNTKILKFCLLNFYALCIIFLKELFMKVLICAFSGTGNTYIAADFIADELKKQGCEVVLHKVERQGIVSLPQDFMSYDRIVLGYPIYAFNVPEPLIDFIKLFPEGNMKKVSIFKTAGEPFFLNKSSSNELKRILHKKEYDILTEVNILMPYNIIFRYNDSLVKQMYYFMIDESKRFADNILNNKRQLIRGTYLGNIISLILRIQRPAAHLNGRLYTTDGNCNMCKKCIRECPVYNISIEDGKICFDGKCVMCMRCVMRCPQMAINNGLLRFWAVKGEYDYQRIIGDEKIEADYISDKTKGYFRLFKKHFNIK